ncbi:hypothetical protein NM208_g8308 [Fusarium decemcellulare]|uniref:Uncharacterized protein n=1 Tax=Fusarium decemcellulare TaxID=57161 RepID=A0ACC1S5S3_9HYPO|nr:hypothetical protein NM208_g8308 [Fusarium decemcellulare]
MCPNPSGVFSICYPRSSWASANSGLRATRLPKLHSESQGLFTFGLGVPGLCYHRYTSSRLLKRLPPLLTQHCPGAGQHLFGAVFVDKHLEALFSPSLSFTLPFNSITRPRLPPEIRALEIVGPYDPDPDDGELDAKSDAESDSEFEDIIPSLLQQSNERLPWDETRSTNIPISSAPSLALGAIDPTKILRHAAGRNPKISEQPNTGPSRTTSCLFGRHACECVNARRWQSSPSFTTYDTMPCPQTNRSTRPPHWFRENSPIPNLLRVTPTLTFILPETFQEYELVQEDENINAFYLLQHTPLISLSSSWRGRHMEHDARSSTLSPTGSTIDDPVEEPLMPKSMHGMLLEAKDQGLEAGQQDEDMFDFSFDLGTPTQAMTLARPPIGQIQFREVDIYPIAPTDLKIITTAINAVGHAGD